MDYKQTAIDIVKNVGGSENIVSVTHCMTRLRFNLKDVSKAKKEDLEAIDGVIGVVYAGRWPIYGHLRPELASCLRSCPQGIQPDNNRRC